MQKKEISRNQFSSIWTIDRNLSLATTQGQSGPRCDGNEGALRIPHSSSIIYTSPSDCLVLYRGHSFGRCYVSAKIQSVYSTAPADWARVRLCFNMCFYCCVLFCLSLILSFCLYIPHLTLIDTHIYIGIYVIYILPLGLVGVRTFLVQCGG